MELTDDVRQALAIKREAERRAQEKRILREKALIDGVFAALRPPDDAADLGVGQVLPGEALGLGQPRPQRRLATEQQPSLSLEELLLRPDYQECIAKHLIARTTLYSLLCTCKRLRDALWWGQTAISFLGLFRTEFGEEHSCRLVPHQRRSLRHMIAAEAPPHWEFGQLRGGILADDPGLGKTVTMLALIVYSAGSRPAMPAEFWGTAATQQGWQALRLNPEARRALLPLLNHVRRKWPAVAAEPAFRALLRFQDKGPRTADEYPTLESFEAMRVALLDDSAAAIQSAWRTNFNSDRNRERRLRRTLAVMLLQRQWRGTIARRKVALKRKKSRMARRRSTRRPGGYVPRAPIAAAGPAAAAPKVRQSISFA